MCLTEQAHLCCAQSGCAWDIHGSLQADRVMFTALVQSNCAKGGCTLHKTQHGLCAKWCPAVGIHACDDGTAFFEPKQAVLFSPYSMLVFLTPLALIVLRW